MLKRLVYFSPIPWSSFDQRPHFMVRHLLRRGVEEVLWLDPYPTRLPRLTDFRRLRKANALVRHSEHQIAVCRVPALPVEPLPFGPMLNRVLCWGSTVRRIEQFCAAGNAAVLVAKPSALVVTLRRRLSRVPFVFDALDDFPMFYAGLSRDRMRRVEADVASASDLVIAASTSLAKKFQAIHGNVEHVANAMDDRAIGSIVERGGDGTLIGYVGTIASWFDWDLVIALARSQPRARVVLVGPVFSTPGKQLPPNIELVGQTSHQEACAWMHRFDVGLIPFRLNELTAGVDPVKYYEYRAVGLPILSTAFGDMRLREGEDGTWLVGPGGDLPAALDAARKYRPALETLASFRSANTWERRFKSSHQLERLLQGHARSVARPNPRTGAVDSAVVEVLDPIEQ